MKSDHIEFAGVSSGNGNYSEKEMGLRKIKWISYFIPYLPLLTSGFGGLTYVIWKSSAPGLMVAAGV